MQFNDFIKEGKVRKALPDKPLIDSLLRTADSDLKFLDTLPITDNSARKLLISYYDTLRSLLEALASKEGYKVYSHEALVYFLKDIKHESLLADKFDRFRKLHNKLNYYGGLISVEEVKEIKPEIKATINQLRKKYLP